MNNNEIDTLRVNENNEIINSLLNISKIIKTKCKRCNTKQSCMGCTFSKGEMIGNVDRCIELMEMLPHDKNLIKYYHKV